MTRYSIPRQFIKGFENIIKLSEEQVSLFADALKEQKPGENLKNVFEKTKGFLNSFSEQDIHGMISAMVSIVEIFEKAKRNIDVFTTDFSDSYLASSADYTAEDREVLKRHLSILLAGYDSVRITAKAQDIILSNKHNFSNARIISDIRIVFDEQVNDNKKIAVVVHNLKLEYSEDAENKEFFISLDLSDLKELKRVIDRAILKDEVIRENKHLLEFIDII